MFLRRVLHRLVGFGQTLFGPADAGRPLDVAEAEEQSGWAPPLVALAALAGAAVVGGAVGIAFPDASSEVQPGDTLPLELPPFSSIEVWDLGAGVVLNVHANLPQRVTVTVHPSTRIRTEVRGDTLVISGTSDLPVAVSVALPELERLVLWGDTRARVRAVDSSELAVTLADTAQLEAEGVATRLELVVDSHSRARLDTLATEVARVTASGASSVHVTVESHLSATVADGAGVYYRGNPEVQQVVHGGGRVSPVQPTTP